LEYSPEKLLRSARRQARLQVLVTGSKLPRNLACREGVPKFATADNVCTEKKQRNVTLEE